jgi:hypothetical protein
MATKRLKIHEKKVERRESSVEGSEQREVIHLPLPFETKRLFVECYALGSPMGSALCDPFISPRWERFCFCVFLRLFAANLFSTLRTRLAWYSHKKAQNPQKTTD